MEKNKNCKDLTHHLPLTRSVVTDEELKNLFNCDRELTTRDYELLINSKVHVDDIYQKKEVDAILNTQQGQLNDHENRLVKLETNKTSGGGTGSDHVHDNKDVLDILAYSGTKTELDLYELEQLKDATEKHYSSKESHTSKSEKDGWNATSEKVTVVESEMSFVKGELNLKASQTELSRVEAKIDGIAMGTGNLLRNSDFRGKFDLWNLIGQENIKLLTENQLNYCHIAQTTGRSCVGQLIESFEPNVNYSISLTAKGSGDLFLEIHQRGDGDDNPTVYNRFTLTETENRYKFTFTSDPDVLENSFYIKLGAATDETCDLKFTKVKFEKGNSATDWTPNASDVLLEVDELERYLKELADYIEVAFKDGIITESECKTLEERIEGFNREKVDVKAQVDILLINALLDRTTEKENLILSYNAFDAAHLELIKGISSVIEDKKITTVERNQIKSLTATYTEKLTNVRVAMQNATSKISESHANNAYDKAQNLIVTEVDGVNKSLDSIRNLTDNIFLNGLVSISEAQYLKLMIEDLEKEKTELIAQVDLLELKTELAGTQELINLGKSEESYVNAHVGLLGCISNICADGKITAEEKKELNLKFDIYKASLVKIREDMQKAQEKIFEVKMSNSLQDAKDYADGQIVELNKELNDLTNLSNQVFKDGVLTIAEKEALKLELKDVHKEQADVLAQVDALNNPHLSPELTATSELGALVTAKDNFVNQYRGLTNVIDDLLKKTLITTTDRQNLADAVSRYSLALATLREKIQVSINKIAEVKAKKETDKIKDNLVYKLEIFSTNGGIFKNGVISTTLQAKVYFGKDEITLNFPSVRFKWSRISNDSFADERWNLSAPMNYEIDITDKDVVGGRTTFNCELLDEKGNKIVSAF